MSRPGKPPSLVTRDETKARKAERAANAAAVRPDRKLPKAAPAILDGRPVAQSTWRRLLRIYQDLEGEIVTLLDQDLLTNYCLLTDQMGELDTMRSAAIDIYNRLQGQYEKLITDGQIAEALLLAPKILTAADAVVKIDARSDRKRTLMLQFEQSLYLTPRARAGVAPTKKEPDEPIDDLEALLNEDF